MTKAESARRNQELKTSLLTHTADPEGWIAVSAKLIDSVIRTQFISVKGTPAEEDIRQSALYEMCRCAPRLSKMAADFTPDSVFRVLFSVAKFTMIRELERLSRGGVARDVRADEEEASEVPYDPWQVRVEPSGVFRDAASSVMGSQPVRYVAAQLILGRVVSPEVLRSVWADDPDRVYTAATVEARSALVRSCLGGCPAA